MKVPVMTPSRYLSWITLPVVLSACSTMADVVGHKDEGTTRPYELSADQAWELTKIVFRTEGADAIEEHRDEGYILTSSGSNFYSKGTVMGAWVEPDSGNGVNVTVLTKRRVKTNLFTTLTEGTFHRRFAQGVRMITSGYPLPAMLPDSNEGNGDQYIVRTPSAPHVANNSVPVSESDGPCRLPESRPQMLSVEAAKFIGGTFESR
jgi:hypothetical protein